MTTIIEHIRAILRQSYNTTVYNKPQNKLDKGMFEVTTEDLDLLVETCTSYKGIVQIKIRQYMEDTDDIITKLVDVITDVEEGLEATGEMPSTFKFEGLDIEHEGIGLLISLYCQYDQFVYVNRS